MLLAKLRHRHPPQFGDLSAYVHRHDSSSFTFSRSLTSGHMRARFRPLIKAILAEFQSVSGGATWPRIMRVFAALAKA
jgi:hypothetical protein